MNAQLPQKSHGPRSATIDLAIAAGEVARLQKIHNLAVALLCVIDLSGQPSARQTAADLWAAINQHGGRQN